MYSQYPLLSHTGTYASYHMFHMVIVQYIFDAALLLHRPFISLKQHGVREGDEVRREGPDDVAHAGDCRARRVVNWLSDYS